MFRLKSETSVRLRFYQNDQFCVSSYPRMRIYVSLIGQSYCSYLSNWWKMENQDLAVLHADSDTAELRYLVCMAQSFELSFVKSFCNVFFHWIRPHWGIEFSISRWNINMVAFSDRVIWLTKWSFHNVFLFSLSSVCWQAAQKIVAYLTMFDCYISPSRWWDYVCFA